MRALTIDHFVIGAASLSTGLAAVASALGARPAGGGRHALMGTHNALWRVGSAYLEVIAIDPDATPPGRARWFGLDEPAVQARLTKGPALLTWVARSDDLSGDIARCVIDPGPALRFARDDLHWRLSVPDDGRPLANGVIPALIEWPSSVTPPSASLPECGVSVERFAAQVTPATRAALHAMRAADLLELSDGRDRLSLELRGPGGRVIFAQ